MREINLNRQKLGLEDLLFGVGIVTQIRAGQNVDVTKINAGNLPFDETQSLFEWAQSINIEALGSMVTELQAIYDNLTTIGNVEDNLTVINTLEDNLVALNSLYTNISKLQNIDTNMSKLQNIDTNMSKLQNIDTNMSKLQAIYTDLTKLESIYDNLTMLLAIYNNLTALNNINSQVIPNLTELLLVNDNAIQVAADKLTVATDKGIVSGYKEDVSAMKLAVETIYDTFDDRFLGTKTSDPTLDNEGNPLIDGAMYFNTSVNALKVYDLGNTTWLIIPQIYLSSLLDVTLTSITTGDILTWNGSKWINTRTPSFDSIKLNGGTGTNGTATWNNAEYTYDIVLNPNVTLQVGQEDLVYCKNNSASVIATGRPVMASGTNGNSGNILVDLHDGTKANARRIVGITTEDLTANGYGFVTRNGKVSGINTTGSQYGETWIDGDILYVKATGNLTKVEPADTALKMPIAFVIHAHTNGTLYIRTTGIDENHDRDLISTKLNTSDVLGSFGNLSSPLLDLPLKNSLTMKAGVGSTTFTRASTATYIDRYGVLKTADIAVPRFEKEGYLNEGSSTNLLTYSDNMLIEYSSNRATLTLSTTELSPNGITYASEFRETTTIGASYIYKSTTFTSGTTYTHSIFAKSINGQNLRLNPFTTSTGFDKTYVASFDLTNGTISGSDASNAKIVPLSNGWYRCSITATCTTTATGNVQLVNTGTDYSSPDYGLYIFGAQLEALQFASSYIPTTDSTVTRSADVLQVTRENNFPNAENNEEGYSVAFDYDIYGLLPTSSQYLWALRVTSADNCTSFITSGGALRNIIVGKSGTIGNSISIANILKNKVVQIQSNSRLYQFANGVLIDSDLNPSGSLGVTTNSLSSFFIGNSNTGSPMYGHIRNFKIYDKALTPTEISLLG